MTAYMYKKCTDKTGSRPHLDGIYLKKAASSFDARDYVVMWGEGAVLWLMTQTAIHTWTDSYLYTQS